MSKFKFNFIIFISCFLLTCKNETQQSVTQENKINSPALQDSKNTLRSYRGESNLVEELYADLVEKSPDLAKLEAEITKFNITNNSLNEYWNKYDSKSKSYYSSADYMVNAMGDSILKQKIKNILLKSTQKYSANTSEINNLINQFSENTASINNYHTILKIVKTLPLIEEYQQNNQPSKTPFQDGLKVQEKLLKQVNPL